MAAPWARNGSIGWAASPSSVTGPSPQRRSGGRSYSAHLSQRSGSDRNSRTGSHQFHGEKCASSSARSPSALQPCCDQLVVDDRDDVDQLAALHRIVDQVRVLAEPELHLVAAEFRLDPIGGDQRTPGGALLEFRLDAVAEPRPQAGPQPVGADQRDAVLVGGDGGLPAGGADAVGMQDEVLDPRAEPQHDVGAGVHRLEQRGLQVAAMDRTNRARRSAVRPPSPSGNAP